MEPESTTPELPEEEVSPAAAEEELEDEDAE